MTDEEETLMSFMGGGIEGRGIEGGGITVVSEGAELGSLVSTQSTRSAHVDGLRSIDVPGALATRAYGINAAGKIVGSYTDATGTYGYLWTNGNFTKIQFPGTVFTEAWGINPQGDIVGRYRRAGVAGLFGFMLSDGIFTDISVSGHLNTLPTKIGASREIVGCFHDTNFLVDMRGYVQRGDRVTSFERLRSTMHNGVTPGGGLIAGLYFESATLVHGYTLKRDVYTQFDAPGATFTEAWDVSPTGTVVGYFNPETSHGFTLDADVFTVIDVPGAKWTRIFGINSLGDMVGSYADASNRVHGFLLPGKGQK
jgi:probable HAF family extracellular repeat protein